MSKKAADIDKRCVASFSKTFIFHAPPLNGLIRKFRRIPSASCLLLPSKPARPRLGVSLFGAPESAYVPVWFLSSDVIVLVRCEYLSELWPNAIEARMQGHL